MDFLPFTPGLVSGHRIGVNPYCLSQRVLELDGMGEWIAERIYEQRIARVARSTLLIILELAS